MTLKEKFIKESLDIKYQILEPKKFEQIADDYAIEFVFFLRKECLIDDKYIYWWYNGAKYTEKELLEIFKKEKGL